MNVSTAVASEGMSQGQNHDARPAQSALLDRAQAQLPDDSARLPLGAKRVGKKSALWMNVFSGPADRVGKATRSGVSCVAACNQDTAKHRARKMDWAHSMLSGFPDKPQASQGIVTCGKEIDAIESKRSGANRRAAFFYTTGEALFRNEMERT
jgi:hypothetical protein